MLIVEKIAAHHDVETFTCGSLRRVREMNRFLREHGADPKEGTTYVVVPYPGSSEIIAYFTMAPDPAVIATVSADGELNTDSFTLLYLAVAQKHQRKGIGRQILLYLADLIVKAADAHPELKSLDLWPLDETARDWYLRQNLGFEQVFSDLLLLSLSVETMRQAIIPSSF